MHGDPVYVRRARASQQWKVSRETLCIRPELHLQRDACAAMPA